MNETKSTRQLMIRINNNQNNQKKKMMMEKERRDDEDKKEEEDEKEENEMNVQYRVNRFRMIFNNLVNQDTSDQ